MTLSIITINYNNLEGLKETVKSVLSQTFKDFEWIVIDGNSTDGSKEFIEQNKEHFSYWVSEPDKGIYNAMNKGIVHATGTFCQFLNSGDSFINEKVLENVFKHNMEKADVYYGNQWCVKDGKIVEKRTYPQIMNLTYLFRAPLGHQASFFRTEMVKKYPYLENYRISADRAFFLSFYVHNYKFEYLNEPIVFFDTDGIGSNAKTLEERRKQFYQIKREFFSNQVTNDIERLLKEEDEYLFMMRVAPIRWVYTFCKKLQSLKDKIR